MVQRSLCILHTSSPSIVPEGYLGNLVIIVFLMRFVLGQLAIPHRMNCSAEGRHQLARLQRVDFKCLSFGWLLATQQQESGHSCTRCKQFKTEAWFSFVKPVYLSF